MKKVLVTIALLGFGFSAQADRGLEIQINGSGLGTGGHITISDEDNTDNTTWGLSGEVYKSMTDKFQLGGMLAVADNDTGETEFAVGLLGRYNFDTELRDSMFAGAGVSMYDNGFGDSMKVNLQFGKRYALSDTITWTPNVNLIMDMGGDDDEGMDIVLNLLSFSGFM